MTQMLQPEFDLLDPNNPTQDDLIEIRRLLLADLRRLKLEKIELTYEGEDDTSQIESFSAIPSMDLAADVIHRIAMFGLAYTYSVNLGCKDSYGNEGVLKWDLANNSIDIFHTEHSVYAQAETHRDL